MKLSSLIVQDHVGPTLNFYASLASKDITITANKLLLINPEDVTLNIEAIRL